MEAIRKAAPVAHGTRRAASCDGTLDVQRSQLVDGATVVVGTAAESQVVDRLAATPRLGEHVIELQPAALVASASRLVQVGALVAVALGHRATNGGRYVAPG